MQVTTNRLLRAISEDDHSRLWPLLKRVELHRGQLLESPGQPVERAFFIESGLVAAVAHSPRRTIGIGVVGFDGMTGLDIVLQAGISANEVIVQAAGSALCIEGDDLRRQQRESETLHQVLLRYVHVFIVQTSQTSLTNGQADIKECLARWILMSQDRSDADLTVTHDFISLMLGVGRPGVTEALHDLEGKHLIRSTRDHIHVVDRASLIAMAAGSYGVCEAAYERLIGQMV